MYEFAVSSHIVELCRYGTPVLETPAFDVNDFSDKRGIIDQMFTIMYENGGVGLAAPQVGLPFRLFVWDDGQGSKGHVFNPFLMKGASRVVVHEGCLSLPGLYLDDISRSKKVVLTGLDVDGKPVSVSASGLTAQILQHEVDHLDGLLFLSRSRGTTHALRLIEDWKIFMGV